MPNLTLKLGVRYDQAKYDNDTGAQVADLNKVQPRIAAAWDVTGDAKNVVRANWGQYHVTPTHHTLQFRELERNGWRALDAWLSCSYFTGMDAETCQACAAAFARVRWRTDPENQDPAGWLLDPRQHHSASPNQLDPNLKAVYVDQLILGYERAVGNRASIEFTYIDKTTKDMFEDTCNGNWPGPPSEGSDCSYFVMANLPELSRSYQGYVVKYENRTFNWLTLKTSYTYSKSKGSQEDRNASELFDVYSVDYENRYGWMGDQRLHRFKLNGFFNIKGDWTIGFDDFYSSDFTWEPTATSRSRGEYLGPRHPTASECRAPRQIGSQPQPPARPPAVEGLHDRQRRSYRADRFGPERLFEKTTGVCKSMNGCGGDDHRPVMPPTGRPRVAKSASASSSDLPSREFQARPSGRAFFISRVLISRDVSRIDLL